MAYHVPNKFSGNLAALKIALQWDGKRPLSAEEKSQLQNYAGFGGIKPIFFPPSSKVHWIEQGATKEDLKVMPQVQELHDLVKEHYPWIVYERMMQSLQNSMLSAFYTPAFVPAAIYQVLKEKEIEPKNLYDPSSGSGVFITEALKAFPQLTQVTAVEKDVLTGLVLEALLHKERPGIRVHISSFENSPTEDDGKYDLIISNIPFGNYRIDDPAFNQEALTSRIHNYFFAKGLTKIGHGGMLAFITTDRFLNSPGNRDAREYLFSRADLITCFALPDNLMKDTGNTEAPTHLILVQKNEQKEKLSAGEMLLLDTVEHKNKFGSYNLNMYLAAREELNLGDRVEPGQNQYGKAAQVIWQDGELTLITEALTRELGEALDHNFNREAFRQITDGLVTPDEQKAPRLTYLPQPANEKAPTATQLGFFEQVAVESQNRAGAYIRGEDVDLVQPKSARILSVIRTTDNPTHEALVLVVAKQASDKLWAYKLFSNVSEIKTSTDWLHSGSISQALKAAGNTLKKYGHEYTYEGDKMMAPFLGIDTKAKRISLDKGYYNEGTLVVHAGTVGTVSDIDHSLNEAAFTPFPGQANTPFYRAYTRLRDGYLELAESELKGVPVDMEVRRALREQYEAFRRQYGFLNRPDNRKLITNDAAFGFTVMASLERKEGNDYLAADILFQSVVPVKEVFRTDDPVAALARSLNDTGGVNLAFMEEATGIDRLDLVTSLEAHILLNPGTGDWETRDKYLSGNVVTKLQTAIDKTAAHPDNEQLKRSLEAIRKVQPAKIPFELLDFNLGERWIPASYYNRFATDIFGTSTDVHYFPSMDRFRVTVNGYSAANSQEYAVFPKQSNTMFGQSLMEHAFENTAPFFTYEKELSKKKKVRVPDNVAIQLAHEKIEQIRGGFITWLQNLPFTDKQALETRYNETFNCYALRQYDGSHLQFPGFVKENVIPGSDVYSSQRSAVWRILQNRGGLIDHEVGNGKTLVMVLSAMEMKRMGMVHKPMIIALAANINQIRDTFRAAYPKARVLAPSDKDFEPRNRKRLFHSIQNNNWDCVIITHDQFIKIPQAPEIQKAIYQEEIANMNRDLGTIIDLGGKVTKRMRKGLEVRISNHVAKMAFIDRQLAAKKDTGIHFRSMGIDHLFVDESHKFKNLTFTTRHSNVAGLGNTAGSQKALNMLFAVRELQQRFDQDLCVTFLSGTPISNSLTELYLIFKYLRPKEMERQQVQNFDAWAAVFARKNSDFEFSVTGEIIAKDRFRHFIKVPELAVFYNEITDYKTAKDINLDKPALIDNLVVLEQSPDEKAFAYALMQFAKTGDGSFIGRAALSGDEDKGRMLIATDIARKMAVDMRLIDPGYADHTDNKINACAREFAAMYHASREHKGVQLVFCDLGTPGTKGFNVYETLREKLVNDFNVPIHEIAFIHDYPKEARGTLYKAVNKGEIAGLFSSSEKGGAGVNVQEQAIAVHDLNVPWKPTEMTQRGARAGRQGNWLAKQEYGNEVKRFVYAKRLSLDSYMFNLHKIKDTFISQMKNNELHVRVIDEGAFDEYSGMNYAEFSAILSGDTSLLEKTKLEKKITVMESLRGAHIRELSHTRNAYENMVEDKERSRVMLSRITVDETAYTSQLKHDKEGTKLNPIQLYNVHSSDPEFIGKHIQDLYRQFSTVPGTGEKEIGTLYGFKLFMRFATEVNGNQVRANTNFFAQSLETGIKYNYNSGYPNMDNPKLAARHFLNAIDRVITLKENYQKDQAEFDIKIPAYEKLLGRPFEREKELQDLRIALSSLERQIAMNIQKSQHIGELHLTDKETKKLNRKPEAPKGGERRKTKSLTQ